MANRKKPDAPPGAPLWLCTFSDMMSLLLCFFVLLFALSTIEKVKFQQTIGSIQGSFGRIPNMFNTSFTKPLSLNPQQVDPVQRSKTLERAKEAIAEKARSKLVADESSKEVIVEGVKEGIRFSIAGRLLFDTGVAYLKPEGQEMLRRVREVLNDFPDLRVRIEGHSDDSPVPPNSIYQNNWKLGAARAMSAMFFLRDDGDGDQRVKEDRLSFMSCGPYRPRFPNDTPEHKALNRRIEIILLQGPNSITVPGELQGSGDRKVDPNQREFVPGM